MPQAFSGVWLVAVTRNDVEMAVQNGLIGSFADIPAKREAVRRMFFFQVALCQLHEFVCIRPFFPRQFECIFTMDFRNDDAGPFQYALVAVMLQKIARIIFKYDMLLRIIPEITVWAILFGVHSLPPNLV